MRTPGPAILKSADKNTSINPLQSAKQTTTPSRRVSIVTTPLETPAAAEAYVDDDTQRNQESPQSSQLRINLNTPAESGASKKSSSLYSIDSKAMQKDSNPPSTEGKSEGKSEANRDSDDASVGSTTIDDLVNSLILSSPPTRAPYAPRFYPREEKKGSNSSRDETNDYIPLQDAVLFVSQAKKNREKRSSNTRGASM